MRNLLRISAPCLIVVMLCVAFVTSADAQQFTSIRTGSRAGTWDFYLPLTYAESATINGEGGSSVDIHADWGWGFGFGYNFTDRFQLNGLWTWNSRSYDAYPSDSNRRYSNWMETSTLALNGVFYLLDGEITPFVSGGVGITFVDTNIQTGPGSTTCWYDPWWGYICDEYAPTRTENDMSYNVGVGVRMDVNPQFGLQASYNKAWVEFGKATGGMPDFAVWRLDFVFRLR